MTTARLVDLGEQVKEILFSFEPEDLFEQEQLDKWALDNGYAKPEEE